MRISALTRSLAAVGVVAAALALTGCGAKTEAASAGTKSDPVVIGIVSSGEDYWKTFQDKAAAAGITVELKNFSDYQLPNQGLADGDLDLNEFQHLQFLADFNVKTGNDLVPIGATAVYSLDLYSTKVKNIADIPDGAEVAVPNDASNQARALLVLQDAGLITLKDGGNSFSTPADVIQDKSKVTVTALKADQTPAALGDPKVYAAIVNNDYVPNLPADSQKPVFASDADSKANDPYINIFVSRKADADNPTFKKLIDIYHQTEVTDGVIKASGGTGIIKDNTPAELQSILATIEKNQKAQG